MRPVIVDWLAALGVPGWLAPDYAAMVGLAGLLTLAIVCGAARRDGDDPRVDATALAAAYVGALLGGYVYEWLRVLPEALLTLRMAPFFGVGRAAYGGLLFGVLAALFVLRRAERPIAPFLDRIALALGPTYALVRGGCFLAGCDYGVPTASGLGVRFPVGSLAAIEHADHGWVPAAAQSLPVHATQLYEGGLALLASACALLVYSRHAPPAAHASERERGAPAREGGPAATTARTGAAFATWIALYAIARVAVEGLRGDVGRGAYLGLSTAEWTSAAALVGVGLWLLHRDRARATVAVGAALVAVVVVVGFGGVAHAQQGGDDEGAWVPVGVDAAAPPTTPAPNVAPPYAGPPYVGPSPNAPLGGTPVQPPPAEPATPPPPDVRVVAIRAGFFGDIVIGAPQGSTGFGGYANGAAVIPLGDVPIGLRLGGELSFAGNRDAVSYELAGLLGVTFTLADIFEIPVVFTPGLAVVDFASPFFDPAAAFRMGMSVGFQFRIERVLLLGLTPIAFHVLAGRGIDTLFTYRPHLWAGATF